MRTIGNPRWSHPVAFINGVDVDMVDVVKMLMIEYTTKDFLDVFSFKIRYYANKDERD